MSQLLFTTPTNNSLARMVARTTGMRIGRCTIAEYPDKEVRVRLDELVEGKDVCVLGSTFAPAEHALQLIILLDTLRLHGAKSACVIVPYFGYARADHIDKSGASVAGKVLADMIVGFGATKVITIAIHSTLAEQFFEVPFLNLSAMPLLASAIRRMNIRNPIVVSPDEGGGHRAREFALALGLSDVVTITKERISAREVRIKKITAGVRGRNVILVDDMITTGDTLIKAAQELKRLGAKNIYGAVVHLVHEGGGAGRISSSRIFKKIVVTDTIPAKKKLPKVFSVVSVAKLLSDVLR